MEAQQRMIVDIGDGQPSEYPLGLTGFALMRRGLLFVNELGARHLTDLGLAVREVLKGEG
jgi:hypothetical protein